jgi:putative solute:sodium symporter small subunit
MNEQRSGFKVNPFSPVKGALGGEVTLILAVLAGWGGVTFGFQLLLWLLDGSRPGQTLSTLTFFNLPFHFWFTGQFLPLWFIVLCIVFNVCLDRLTYRHSRRRDKPHE